MIITTLVSTRTQETILGDTLQKTFPENAQLFADRQTDFSTEYVILALGDFFQQLAIDVDQHKERGLAVFGNVRNELIASLVAFARPISFEFE